MVFDSLVQLEWMAQTESPNVCSLVPLTDKLTYLPQVHWLQELRRRIRSNARSLEPPGITAIIHRNMETVFLVELLSMVLRLPTMTSTSELILSTISTIRQRPRSAK